MARLNTRASTVDSLYRDRTPTYEPRSTAAPLPNASFSSDKENQSSSQAPSAGKRPLAEARPKMANGTKRRRLEDQGAQPQRRRREADDDESEDDDAKFYDPNQNQEERREVRIAMRKNMRELQDRADEFLNNEGTGLASLIKKQDRLMDKVKQTSDATMDSRFLINASELNLKKARALAMGDSATRIDVDEFVSKCITFMTLGRPANVEEDGNSAPTQARRNQRRARAGDNDDDDDEDAIEMDWQVFGEQACFPNNKRPTTPSFLLGPLSVEKRVRATQRRATQRRDQVVAAQRPQQLREEDLEKNEASNLTSQCGRIRDLLRDISRIGTQKVEEDADEDMDEDEARAVFYRHNLATNWEVPLLKFVINPESYGQTVENLFYVSFLVKDGFVAVGTDEHGFPTIRPQEPKSADEARAEGNKRHQAIFSLSYKEWTIFRLTMRIKESLIPNREPVAAQPTGGAWYG